MFEIFSLSSLLPQGPGCPAYLPHSGCVKLLPKLFSHFSHFLFKTLSPQSTAIGLFQP